VHRTQGPTAHWVRLPQHSSIQEACTTQHPTPWRSCDSLFGTPQGACSAQQQGCHITRGVNRALQLLQYAPTRPCTLQLSCCGCLMQAAVLAHTTSLIYAPLPEQQQQRADATRTDGATPKTLLTLQSAPHSLGDEKLPPGGGLSVKSNSTQATAVHSSPVLSAHPM
jgi:hypothetical protein